MNLIDFLKLILNSRAIYVDDLVPLFQSLLIIPRPFKSQNRYLYFSLNAFSQCFFSKGQQLIVEMRACVEPTPWCLVTVTALRMNAQLAQDCWYCHVVVAAQSICPGFTLSLLKLHGLSA